MTDNLYDNRNSENCCENRAVTWTIIFFRKLQFVFWFDSLPFNDLDYMMTSLSNMYL